MISFVYLDDTDFHAFEGFDLPVDLQIALDKMGIAWSHLDTFSRALSILEDGQTICCKTCKVYPLVFVDF